VQLVDLECREQSVLIEAFEHRHGRPTETSDSPAISSRALPQLAADT
jgi:hypothetical protein